MFRHELCGFFCRVFVAETPISFCRVIEKLWPVIIVCELTVDGLKLEETALAEFTVEASYSRIIFSHHILASWFLKGPTMVLILS